MKRLCNYPSCREIATHESRCNKHKLETKYKNRKSYGYMFDKQGKYVYSTQTWRKLRDAYITANPFCECERCKKAIAPRVAVLVDHVVELKDGGEPYDWDNLQSMSNICHNRKTFLAKKARESKNNKDDNNQQLASFSF